MKKPFVLMFIVAFAICLSGCAGKTNDSSAKTPTVELNEAVQTFIDSDPGSVDEKIIEYWCDEERQQILNNLEGSYVPEVLFVRAYLTLYTEGTYPAVTKFEDCIRFANPRTDYDIIGKCYYEMIRHVIFNARVNLAEKHIEKLMSSYDGTSNRDRQINCLLNLAEESQKVLDDKELSLDFIKKAKNLVERFSYSDMPYYYYKVGHIYSEFNLMQVAYQYYFEALNASGESADSVWNARIYSEIAKNYFERNYFEEAIDYYERAFSILASVPNETSEDCYEEIDIADLIAEAYFKTGNKEQADFWLETERDLINEAPEGNRKEDAITVYLCSLSGKALSENDTEEALNYLKTARERYNESENFSYSEFDIYLYKLFGDIYRQIGNSKIAKEYYQKAESSYSKLGKAADVECYRALYELCNERGLTEQAIMYGGKLADALEASLEETKNDQSEFIIESFESDRRDKEIDLLKNNNNLLSLLVASGIILVGVSSYLGMVSYNKSKEIKKLNEKLLNASMIDELTQLNNRRSLNQYLDEEWDALAKSGKPVSLAMIDVDFFKKYNDYYGHQDGDNVLAEVALAIHENLELNDFAARYGGEEFIIIMPDTTREEAVKRLDVLQKSLAILQIEHAKSPVSKYVTISIGIATSIGTGRYMSLISAADGALYRAKETRNTIESVFYE